MKQKAFKFLAVTLFVAIGIPGIVSNYVIDNKISTKTLAYAQIGGGSGYVFETCTKPNGGDGGKCITIDGSCGVSTACD
jgi:hypothetical protein